MIYPAAQVHSGRDVQYGYGQVNSPTFAQTVDNVMSRLAQINESDGTTVDATFAYLGADTIATESYVQSQIKLDYSANNFAALDRFGDVLNQFWSSYGSASGSAGTLDGYTYTYNQAGDRMSSANATYSAVEPGLTGTTISIV